MTGSSLYRQWRPYRFDEVVGQEHVVTTLKNALLRDQVGHAYIFAGPRGTGKTTIARLLAKSVNCRRDNPEEVEPCNECEPCRDVMSGNSMNVVELDAASHRGIDDIRELQERVPYANPKGRFRVYILDEAHMLTPEAFNALLKTLEEPPAHVIFILCTTEPHKIPVTIQSRCQRFDFRYLTVVEIVERLRHVVEADESLEVEDAALWAIAVAGEGAVRDALGLLEQVRDYAGGLIREEDVRQITGAVSRTILFDYARKMANDDVGGLLELVEDVVLGGADVAQFIRELLGMFRDMMLLRASQGTRKPVIPEDDLTRMIEVLEGYDLPRLLAAVDALAETESRARHVSRPSFLLEMTTIRLAHASGSSAREIDLREDSDPGDKMTAAPDGAGEGARMPEERRVDSKDTVATKPSPRDEVREVPGDDSGRGLSEDGWERVKEIVRRSNMPAYALLQPAEPGPIREGEVFLIFQDGFSYHRERTEKENRQLVEQAIGEVLERPVKIKCLFASEVPGGTSNSTSPSSGESDSRDAGNSAVKEESRGEEETTTGDEDPALERVLDAFNGKVIGGLEDADFPT